MKFSAALVAGAVALPGVSAWGGFGHITVAYIATSFVADETAAFFQDLLRNQTGDYLANVATWADSIRYTQWGRFTGPFHFIDAKDHPPASCSVDLARDCKTEAGCIVTALHNYTARLLDADDQLSVVDRAQAAKFVVHFVGDIHQPLHDEDVARGGNGLYVTFRGAHLNLHHVWDTTIPETVAGRARGRSRSPSPSQSRGPFDEARRWADELVAAIQTPGGRYAHESPTWLDGLDLADPEATALRWARQGNAYVCTTVLPEGPDAIVGQELGADYYEKAAPVVEIQIARAGYRLAAWLDQIAAAEKKKKKQQAVAAAKEHSTQQQMGDL